MPATPDDESNRTDRPPDDPERDEPSVIFEIAVPADAFILENALQEFPDVIVEFERFIPANDRHMPYLWATDGQPQFTDAMENDPQVAHVRTVATFDDGALYRVGWTLHRR